jgi:2-epi-5-epi-valiolone synthase
MAVYRMQCETSRQYDVLVSDGLLDRSNPVLADTIGIRRALVVTDPTVDALYGTALRAALGDHTVLVLDLDEQTKTMASVLEVCAAAQQERLGRRDLLIAVGGGIVCDVVSVAATLIRRGIPYVCVPTTLVGDIDAGVGLKGGVNFGPTKNYLGSFNPPSRVLVDPTFLRTLPAAELCAGFAEVLKMAIVCDSGLFDLVHAAGPDLIASGFASAGAAEVLDRSITLMLDELSANTYEELGYERLVDFGHTFSPILEEVSGYTLRHGEAVALDMAVSSAIAVIHGLFPREEYDRVIAALDEIGLPTASPLCSVPNLARGLVSAAAHRDGDLNLVVPERIGQGTFIKSLDHVSLADLSQAVELLEGSSRPAATNG